MTTGGESYCWGLNDFGQLGDGTTTDISFPSPVHGGHSFATVSPGPLHTCGMTMGGSAYCWGFNGDAALGDGTLTDISFPVLVLGGLSFAAVSAGTHTRGVATGGSAYCWGFQGLQDGQLGTGAPPGRYPTPDLVQGGLSFAAVSAGVRECRRSSS